MTGQPRTKKRYAVIDADSIAYAAASVAQDEIRWSPDEEPMTASNPAVVRTAAIALADKWIKMAGAKTSILVLSDRSRPRSTFRYRFYPKYKTGRSEATRPELLDYARSVLMGSYDTLTHPGLEADDAIGLWMTGVAGEDSVSVSIDKDMLTLPGYHINPRTGKVHVQSKLDADKAWATQTIIGDKVDGYPGIPNSGPAAARKILGGALDREAMFAAIVDLAEDRHRRAAQVAKFLGSTPLDFALEQARLAHILQDGEYKDEGQGPRVKLWQPDGNGEWIHAYPPDDHV